MSEGKKNFVIPVSWEVYSTITVSANSLEEALEWAEKHSDEIPITMDECEYIDASYKIDTEVAGTNIAQISSLLFDAETDFEEEKDLD